MSIHAEFDNPQPAAIGNTPIVLRFQGLHPNDLGRFQMHDARSGGDLSHVDPGSTALNEHLFGEEGWKETLLAEVDQAKRQNIHAHVAAQMAKSRKKEARGVQEQGLVDPWMCRSHGPLREGILTVNKKWFGGTGHANWDPKQVDRFREAALAFLQQHFPDGQLRYASGHADEEAYHIHFVIAVWRERITVNRGQQILLQASMNPLLGNYEYAQDLAGDWFDALGITRGARHAEARREAKRTEEPVPAKRRHVPPSEWRAEQQKLTQAEAQQTLAAASQTAGTIVEEGRTLAKATVRKSRKRAIKEARERKERAAREAKVETEFAARQRDALAREAAQIKVAAEAAEQEKNDAEGMLVRAEGKVSVVMKRLQSETDRLRALTAEHGMEVERIQALRVEKFEEEAARDRAREEISAAVMTKDEVMQRVQAAQKDLEQLQDRTAAEGAEETAARDSAKFAKDQNAAEELILEATKMKREEEEAKLKAAKLEVKAAETAAADIERTADAVADAIELIADGVFQSNGDPGSAPKLGWGFGAPQGKDERAGILDRVRLAGPFIGRLAQMVKEAVQAVLATERAELAKEAAFVAGLRANWDADQKARLDGLSDMHEPD